MALPNSYMYKINGIKKIFKAVLDAQAPERFSQKFLEQLGFKSKGDRLFIGVLKDLGFIDTDGKPSQRYFDYLDRSQSGSVLARAIEEAYSDLFVVNTQAFKMKSKEANDKLRTLYAGKKTDHVITQVAKTFEALCAIADFSAPSKLVEPQLLKDTIDETTSQEGDVGKATPSADPTTKTRSKSLGYSLQYHINIVLPESRNQAVYDALFKSLREHLG